MSFTPPCIDSVLGGKEARSAIPHLLAIAVAIVAPLLTAIPARAQDGSKKSEKPVFTVSGHVELDFASEHNFDLDRGSNEDFTVLEPELRLRLGYVPRHFMQFFGQFRPRKKLTLHDEDKKKERVLQVELEELYFGAETEDEKYGIRIGRTRFKDDREWLYDDNMDGVRAFFTVLETNVETSVVGYHYRSEDLNNENEDDAIANIHVYASRKLPRETFLAAYWLAQDNRARSDDPVLHFVGLRSGGEPRKGLVYWAELAHVLGSKDGMKVGGTGVDLGFHYELPGRLRPYPILGYAFGTGDDNPDDDKDRNFRQTGHQDNNSRYAGVAKYKYYGELMEPELSNMGIATAGLGIRPWKRTSFDLVYHQYKQHHAADYIRDSNLDADPDGVNTDLGQAVDFVIGFREIKNLRAEAVAAWFFPGSAFDPEADSTFYSGIEFRYYF